MILLDTDEKWDWFMNVLDNNELQVVSKKLTKKDDEEICRAIEDHKYSTANLITGPIPSTG